MRSAALLAGLAAIAWPVLAEAKEVDVELALMVDVSRSMGPAELEIQRRGYAEAITSDEVVNVILNSFTGSIAVTFVEWAGYGLQREIVPWTLIDSREAAEAVSTQLTADFNYAMRRTSISGAVDYARESIRSNEFEGLRKVIDISGDGPNNDGRPVTEARDIAVEEGLIVNGLPLMTEDSTSRWGIDDLDVYYWECVVGGPGAFVIPVLDWDDFPLAVRRKLVLELVGPPDVVLAQGRTGQTEDGYDCLIGEKLRRQRESIWGEP
ncbi:DUF1194 domain-containing protein [Silicimonas sp. MF1-12-2]|uniref:DUF1194 domain-containing protein n=1 Tax=Silicimonas sp. MF1-12-2 TaxID=3384793 RepID=UPI0039B586A8